MINNVYRLVSPRLIEKTIVDEQITNQTVVVRPSYLSICHADQRYYNGLRDPEVLNKKLPMALIHEGVGVVVKDYSGNFVPGDRVSIVPNTPFEVKDNIQENYLASSKFRSSGYDGLMQEYVFARNDRLVSIPDNIPSRVAAFIEMASVSMHSINRLGRVLAKNQDSFGIWGDGNLGYITAVLLKSLYPDSKLFIFGKNERKLDMFSFADATYTIDSIPEKLHISNAFEAAGGKGSQYAIDQITQLVDPQGSVALMGVSENPIEVNTRKLLEKGLTVSATSRSGVSDFKDVINLLTKNEHVIAQLEILIGVEKSIHKLSDIQPFFEDDLSNLWGKSIMKWDI